MLFSDADLLAELSERARASPRGRMNRNFHTSLSDRAHRMLNAVEPGTYFIPHRHLDPQKSETLVCVAGRFGAIAFDEEGHIQVARLVGFGQLVDIPTGEFHTVVSLEPGTIFFEAKAGPYVALKPEELAPWAPEAGAPAADGYLAKLEALFR